MPRKIQPASGQLSLFDDIPDARPLPIIVAERWGFPLQYHIVDGVHWFSVHDWYAGISQKQDATSDVKKLMTRNTELWKLFHSMEYRASNNRRYQMPFGIDKSLYDLVQQMKVTTGAAKEIGQFLSAAGAFADLARREPETVGRAVLSYSDKRKRQELTAQGWSDEQIQQWLDVRSVQRVSAGRVAAAWERGGIVEKRDYAKLHNTVSEVATGNTATQHKIALHTDKPREGLSAYENAAIHVVQTVAELFHTTRQSHGLAELTTDRQDSDAVINRDELARQMSKTRPRLATGK